MRLAAPPAPCTLFVAYRCTFAETRALPSHLTARTAHLTARGAPRCALTSLARLLAESPFGVPGLDPVPSSVVPSAGLAALQQQQLASGGLGANSAGLSGFRGGGGAGAAASSAAASVGGDRLLAGSSLAQRVQLLANGRQRPSAKRLVSGDELGLQLGALCGWREERRRGEKSKRRMAAGRPPAWPTGARRRRRRAAAARLTAAGQA